MDESAWARSPNSGQWHHLTRFGPRYYTACGDAYYAEEVRAEMAAQWTPGASEDVCPDCLGSTGLPAGPAVATFS